LVNGCTLLALTPPSLLPYRPNVEPSRPAELTEDQLEEKFRGYTNSNIWQKLLTSGKELKLALEYFDYHASALLEAKEFTTLPPEVVVKIICRDSLGPESEVQIFDACHRWVTAELKKEKKIN